MIINFLDGIVSGLLSYALKSLRGN